MRGLHRIAKGIGGGDEGDLYGIREAGVGMQPAIEVPIYTEVEVRGGTFGDPASFPVPRRHTIRDVVALAEAEQRG